MRNIKAYILALFLWLSVLLGAINTLTVEAKTAKGVILKPFVVYQDDKVAIMFRGINSRGVVFYVNNVTNANITIQADSVSLNRGSINSIMSDDVAPHSVGIVKAKCAVLVAAEDVVSVGGQLRIIDFKHSFAIYKATFVNVDIVK